MESVVEGTERALDAASHLTETDAGAIAVLRVLAVKIDALAGEEVQSLDDLKAKFDNVSVPTYLKFCESLGLTPAGRQRLELGKKENSGGSLAKLRSVKTGKRPA